MNFRECRQAAIKEILSYINPELTNEKNFLLLGGMCNGIYLFDYRGIKLYGLCGCGEINSPGIFDTLQIEYSTIKADQFLMVYGNQYHPNDYFFVIPAVREILNAEEADLNDYNLVGHSYFTVDRVDEKRIYLNTYDMTEPYYLDINVFRKLNNSRSWIMESDFEISCINKKALIENNYIKNLMQKTEEEILFNNVNKFLTDEKNIGDQGTIRYDGRQVYKLMADHLTNMITHLENTQQKEKKQMFKRYIYLQLVNFRKMLAAGSDAYYRSEFSAILGNYPQYEQSIASWDNIVSLWRKFGRKLAQVANQGFLEHNAKSGLRELVQIWEEIEKREIEGILQLKILINEHV